MAETINAEKTKIGPDSALKLLEGISTLVCIVRGKNIVTIDLKNERPDDATLLEYMIGPTGNLRAPTVRIGNRLVVGYNEEAYQRFLS